MGTSRYSPPPSLDGEILGPEKDEPVPSLRKERRGLKPLRDAMRATFDEMSIRSYLAVFGAVPDRPPYRQWLYLGRARDAYLHIANVWADAALRERMLARLQRDRRSWVLFDRLQRDLEYLDEFAAAGRAPKLYPEKDRCLTPPLLPGPSARLPGWRAG
jgi:hypothetical protein